MKFKEGQYVSGYTNSDTLVEGRVYNNEDHGLVVLNGKGKWFPLNEMKTVKVIRESEEDEAITAKVDDDVAQLDMDALKKVDDDKLDKLCQDRENELISNGMKIDKGVFATKLKTKIKADAEADDVDAGNLTMSTALQKYVQSKENDIKMRIAKSLRERYYDLDDIDDDQIVDVVERSVDASDEITDEDNIVPGTDEEFDAMMASDDIEDTADYSRDEDFERFMDDAGTSTMPEEFEFSDDEYSDDIANNWNSKVSWMPTEDEVNDDVPNPETKSFQNMRPTHNGNNEWESVDYSPETITSYITSDNEITPDDPSYEQFKDNVDVEFENELDEMEESGTFTPAAYFTKLCEKNNCMKQGAYILKETKNNIPSSVLLLAEHVAYKRYYEAKAAQFSAFINKLSKNIIIAADIATGGLAATGLTKPEAKIAIDNLTKQIETFTEMVARCGTEGILNDEGKQITSTKEFLDYLYSHGAGFGKYKGASGEYAKLDVFIKNTNLGKTFVNSLNQAFADIASRNKDASTLYSGDGRITNSINFTPSHAVAKAYR